MSPKRQARTQTGTSRPRDITSNGFPPAYMAEIQRARMLSAMAEVAFERGAANVTVAHVVARSGVSRRTFYAVFEDRHECFLAALDDAIARVSEIVLCGYEDHDRWRERIRGALVALLEFLDAEPAAGRLLIVESLGGGPAALERRARLLSSVVKAVEEGQAERRTTTGLPALTAEGIVGGVLSVIHGRLLESQPGSLRDLSGALMGMIVLPYLGPAAAQDEIDRPVPRQEGLRSANDRYPLRELQMRLTYRTVRVLVAVAANRGGSNREIGLASGVADQGQISKLLARLERLGLVRNTVFGQGKGGPNAWSLTDKGAEIERAMRTDIRQRAAG